MRIKKVSIYGAFRVSQLPKNKAKKKGTSIQMDKRYMVEGFCFESPEEYEEAKKEAEAIRYLCVKTDLNNITNLVKVYNKLIEKGNFITPVGFTFLQELRKKIVASGAIAENNLRGVEIKKEKPKKSQAVQQMRQAGEQRYKEQTEKLKIKLRNSRIISMFLCVIIIAMFVMTLFMSNYSPMYDKEMELQNKYAAWEEELKNKEIALKEKEAELNK